ncbi:MAG TPA: hypothetical protein VLS88_00170 [Polyangiales bacterium]|nr:hypothetical protein [Polyangiales bacterium]
MPLLALGAVALVAGLWGGLLRLGLRLPVPSSVVISNHGMLMICGFLGTLIGVERAVALERRWAYGAPLLTGLGSIAVLLGAPAMWGVSAIVAGSAIFFAASIAVVLRQPASFTITMAAGAVAWVLGNALWWMDRPIYSLVWWWAGFLLLTIVGERLELSRLIHRPKSATVAFVAACALFLFGVAAAEWHRDAGTRTAGAGMIAIAVWLGLHDVARRTVRQRGLPRYIAVCLLCGYAWLLVCGAALVGFGPLAAGPEYDAALHAFFVGFVFSMIFGHGPIILPAVLRVSIRYRPFFYWPLALLHFSLVARLIGDLSALPDARLWGGALNAVAIVGFFASMAWSAKRPASSAVFA